MTITLGDEFQGVVKDVKAALEIVLDLEEYTDAIKKSIQIEICDPRRRD
ncbi:MAG: hypothetical protein WDN75_07065 [Bacteroidota bacterium]